MIAVPAITHQLQFLHKLSAPNYKLSHLGKISQKIIAMENLQSLISIVVARLHLTPSITLFRCLFTYFLIMSGFKNHLKVVHWLLAQKSLTSIKVNHCECLKVDEIVSQIFTFFRNFFWREISSI